MVHDYYSSRFPSGENLSFESEVSLLRQRGHVVTTYTRHNDEIGALSITGHLSLPLRAVWNPGSRRELGLLLAAARPAVAHFQNTFPLISPSAYAACRDAGVPVVQAVRNYRLACAAGTLFRDGRPCEDCAGRRIGWPGILNACYRDSRLASGVVTLMSAAQRVLRDQGLGADLYVAPSRFARDTLIRAGLPPERVAVKPNFLPTDPGPRSGPGEGALFAGRLSRDKGILTLLEAWKGQGGYPLSIAGDGPLRTEVERRALRIPGVKLLGLLPPPALLERLRQSAFVVFPSEWYETFGRVIMEAFACGVPVITSRLGAMAEAVEHGRNGLLFTPGSPDDLTAQITRARANGRERAAMGAAARESYEQLYDADRNHGHLMGIYEHARSLSCSRRTQGTVRP